MSLPRFGSFGIQVSEMYLYFFFMLTSILLSFENHSLGNRDFVGIWKNRPCGNLTGVYFFGYFSVNGYWDLLSAMAKNPVATDEENAWKHNETANSNDVGPEMMISCNNMSSLQIISQNEIWFWWLVYESAMMWVSTGIAHNFGGWDSGRVWWQNCCWVQLGPDFIPGISQRGAGRCQSSPLCFSSGEGSFHKIYQKLSAMHGSSIRLLSQVCGLLLLWAVVFDELF